jgi:hypothetical protein
MQVLHSFSIGSGEVASVAGKNVFSEFYMISK